MSMALCVEVSFSWSCGQVVLATIVVLAELDAGTSLHMILQKCPGECWFYLGHVGLAGETKIKKVQILEKLSRSENNTKRCNR